MADAIEAELTSGHYLEFTSRADPFPTPTEPIGATFVWTQYHVAMLGGCLSVLSEIGKLLRPNREHAPT
jgi:hypothetical protein